MLGTTQTGLDRLVDLIRNDPGLAQKIPSSEIKEGADAADALNALIIDAIRTNGLANDGDLTRSDVLAINEYIRSDQGRLDAFTALHGDDEANLETGFHLVRGDGATSNLYGANAVNTVADGLYNIGFGIQNTRYFLNEDGARGVNINKVVTWLNNLLAEDLSNGSLATGEKYSGTTGTGLDGLIDVITDDEGLQFKISEFDIREGADAADAINNLIIEAIEELGLGQNGKISTADGRDINKYIRDNYYDEFVEAHGNDEDGIETGYHLVQNDGGTGILYGMNAINNFLDGIYHIGFVIRGSGRLENEDGNGNRTIAQVSSWLDDYLTAGDLKTLGDNAPIQAYVYGSTGTGLDSLVNIVTEDAGLNEEISTTEIRGGAAAAQGMNEIILDAIKATAVANDGVFTAGDIYEINSAIRSDAATLALFTELHGDDEGNVETGFHLVQNDGSTTQLYGENAIDTVADGLYHLGFEIKKGRLLNEDGDANATVEDVADWLNKLLATELANGDLGNSDQQPGDVGLDGLKAKEVFALTDPFAVTKQAGEQSFDATPSLALSEATVFVSFEASNVANRRKDTIFSRDGAGDKEGDLQIYGEKSDLFAIFSDGADEIKFRVDNVLENGTEHDVAFSFDGASAKLYLDGALVASGASSADWLSTDEDIALGGSLENAKGESDNTRHRFEGTIEEALIFDEALSVSEIQAVAGPDYALA